jgi:hypothetical protein
VTAADHPGWTLREQAKRVAIIEKYRRRAQRVACLAIDLRDSDRPFLTALWIEADWEPDESLDRLVTEDAPIPMGRLPGVNDPASAEAPENSKNAAVLKFGASCYGR